MSENEEKDTLERDKLLVKLMIHTYDEEVNRNELIDSKNSQMIVLTGAMLTLQATLFTNLLAQKVLFNAQMINSWKILLSGIMLCSLGWIMLALFQFIKSFEFKKSFKQAPNPPFLLKMYNDDTKGIEDVFDKILNRLPKTMDNNRELMAEKVHVGDVGFKYLKYGSVFSLIFVVLFLVSMIH